MPVSGVEDALVGVLDGADGLGAVDMQGIAGVLGGGGVGVGVSGGVTPGLKEPWAEWVNLDGAEGPALLGVEV